MNSYGIKFRLEGTIEVHARNEEEAVDKYNDMDIEDLVQTAMMDDPEVQEIEIVEDYRDDKDE